MFPLVCTTTATCVTVLPGGLFHLMQLSHPAWWDSHACNTGLQSSLPAARHVNYSPTVNVIMPGTWLMWRVKRLGSKTKILSKGQELAGKPNKRTILLRGNTRHIWEIHMSKCLACGDDTTGEPHIHRHWRHLHYVRIWRRRGRWLLG